MPKSKPYQPGQYVTIFTDASFCPQTKVFGWAVWIKYGHPARNIKRSGGGTCKGPTYAEYIALKNALKTLGQFDIPTMGKIVIFQSDCLAALNKFQRRDHKIACLNVVYRHVKAHTGNDDRRSIVNDLCDRQAKLEMRKRRHEALQNCG